jgi:hypothetical protein
VPGHKTPPRGHVSMTAIADKLHVDRRVLKELYELDRIAGVRTGGVIWLERRSLAAYLWSRLRCVREDCDRRVIGRGPGCHVHRRDGRRRHRAVVRPRKQRPLASDRLERLQEGRGDYRTKVERVKAERGLLSVAEVLERLPQDLRRSPAAVSGHVRVGLLEREHDVGFDKPYLFTVAAADEYAERLKEHKDGRMRRFEDASFAGKWHQGRHKNKAGYGKRNVQYAKAKGTRVGRPRGSGSVLTRELKEQIATLRAEGRGNREIAREIHVSEATVRRFKPAS